MTENEIPQSLIDAIQNGRASLFLGAGASREANFPTGDELALHLARSAGGDIGRRLADKPLDLVAQYLYQQPGFGKQWVSQTVIGHLANLHKKVKRPPSNAHRLLTRIKWRTIFTTNYDRLVEISYDSDQQAVQRILPIFRSDPQVMRHEPEVVRCVKLNGSMDEAERTSDHELVFTFAEQQDARSRNRQLYQLLAEEAINGPIVFIGFSFTHPGAYAPGSSPEFEQLRTLLRDMGPKAKWHFCVTPIGEPSDASELWASELSGNQVAVINATFSEFLDSVVRRLEQRPAPLSGRPPIAVPIGTTRLLIEADRVDLDRRHFQVLGEYIDQMPIPTVSDSLNGRATWASFTSGHVIQRKCAPYLRTIMDELTEEGGDLLFVGASHGWGKTFLLMDLAVQMYRDRRPVIWLNPNGTIEVEGETERPPVVLGTWDVTRLDQLLGQIAEVAKRDGVLQSRAIPVIIADNCSERAREILSLYRTLKINGRTFVLIFSTRLSEFDKLVADQQTLAKARQFRPDEREYAEDEVRILVDFCANHHVATFESAGHRAVVADRIIDERADTALILALQVIFDKNHRPFRQIVSDLWHSLVDLRFGQEVVARVASFHRFGSEFSPRLYSLLQTFAPHDRAVVIDTYNECLVSGVLHESLDEDEPCVYTIHSLVAERFVLESELSAATLDEYVIELVRCMTGTRRDLEIVRHLLKRITDYDINLSSEDTTERLFEVAAAATESDWVVCQQFAKFLLKRQEFDLALAWSNRAISSNSDHAPLLHTKGNVLRRWGMSLSDDGNKAGADAKFEEAARCFAASRVRREADEYGYVTHLDLIRYRLEHEQDAVRRANLLAEGVNLYQNSLRSVAEDRFNMLLEERFSKTFDIDGEAIRELCASIDAAVNDGHASSFAAVFLANALYSDGNPNRSLEVLKKQRKASDTGVLLWITEAEILARIGNFEEAAKSVDSARRRSKNAENAEVVQLVAYWDLLISFVREDFREARAASSELASRRGLFGLRYPRGYVWKAGTETVSPERRSFREHARIWTGRVQNFKSGGHFGEIVTTNWSGENFYIPFNQRYFSRMDMRRGDRVKFVVTILEDGLRADDIDTKPFAKTTHDLFVSSQ